MDIDGKANKSDGVQRTYRTAVTERLQGSFGTPMPQPGRSQYLPDPLASGELTAMSTAPSSLPEMSPDGRFYWDGSAWRPFTGSSLYNPAVGPAVAQVGPRKRPGGYIFASFLIIGLGTMLAGSFWKGFRLFIKGLTLIGLMMLILLEGFVPSTSGRGTTVCLNAVCFEESSVIVAGIAALTLTAWWIYGMVDAARSVRDWNRRNGWTH